MTRKGTTHNLLNELRRAAETKRDKKEAGTSPAPRLKELTDKQLVLLWEEISTGNTTNKGMVDVIKKKWKKFPDIPNERLETLIGIFHAEMKRTTREGDALALSWKVKQLQHQVTELAEKKEDIERKLVDTFNPLYELAILSNTQKERIKRFVAIEEEEEKPNKQVDEMIDKQRLLIAEFVRSIRDLKFAKNNDERKPSPAEQHLHQVHVHLQSVITSPTDMTSAIDNLENELDQLVVIPKSEPVPVKGKAENDSKPNKIGPSR